jgi:hypothetical protein
MRYIINITNLNLISIQKISDLIESLRALELGLNYDKILKDTAFIDKLFNTKTELFEYVITDIWGYDYDSLVYLLSIYMNNTETPTSKQIKNMESLISDIISNKDGINPESIACKPDNLYEYYRKYPNPKIIDFIVEFIYYFTPLTWNPDRCSQTGIPDYIFKEIVKRFNRNDFYEHINNHNYDGLDDQLIKDSFMKAYDKAAKERAVEVSIGLGYAQMDNQVQSTIPSLVLQQIVNESADLSGMPAWQVYQIVKHINEGTTDRTTRLGVPSNFEDAKE